MSSLFQAREMTVAWLEKWNEKQEFLKVMPHEMLVDFRYFTVVEEQER